MPRWSFWPEPRTTLSAVARYGIAAASAAVAFSILYLLRHNHVRSPYALVFVAAIGVSFWYGGNGPGGLAIVLCSLGLKIFLPSPHGWFYVASYDLPFFAAYSLFVALIYLLTRSRRRIERSLREARDQLEAEVQARTAEYARINAEYKTILDAAPFGVALLETDRIVRRCNPAYERMIGFDPGELVGHSAPLPDSEKETWKRLEEELHSGKSIVNREVQRIRKDGAEFPATISAIPLFENGQFNGIVGLIFDNTKRRAQASERQMLTTLVQNSPDFVGVATLSGLAVFVNHAGRKLIGLEASEDIERTKLLELFFESDQREASDTLVLDLEQRRWLEFETIGRNLKTGTRFPLHCMSFVIPDARTGEPSLLAVTARDISERKRIEEELRHRDAYLTEGQEISHTGSWAWNATTGESSWSQGLLRILGLDPQSEQRFPSGYCERVHPDDEPELTALWHEAVEQKKGIDHKHRILWPDGSIRFVRFLGRPFSIGDPEREMIGTVMDETEQHADREALQNLLSDNETLLEENRVLQEKLRRENISLQELNLALQGELADIQRNRFEQIIGATPALQRTLVRVGQVASTDATVLITGETGTGKELIAQAIHENSKRARMPFRSVNCAALPATLMAAELFGYEKGAFTGADRQRVGQFELASGGTLFLDEIGELPIDTQAMLLRVLEERILERLGGSKPISADVRVIAATNRDLQVAMRAGNFRPDLFYRLNAFPIEVPPLRERRDDIPMLVTHFIAVSAARHGRTIRNIEKRGMELLRSYDWPGNIRELRNVIDTSVIVANGEVLSIDEEQLLVARSSEDAPMGSLQKEMANHERMLIERALEETQGRVYGPSGAGAILHVPPTTLSAKMKALGIDPSKFKGRLI
jgi:PAS domain S-box-containing protein